MSIRSHLLALIRKQVGSLAFVRNWVPPFLWIFIRNLLGARDVKWSRPTASWSEVAKRASGYDNLEIPRKVAEAVDLVRQGKAAFERDAVAFTKAEYEWPVLSALFYAQVRCKALHVLDFGGSLGSCYWQHRDLLQFSSSISWSVVEQGEFVRIGHERFESEVLHFYSSISDACKAQQCNVLLLGSVLCYLENPWQILAEAEAESIDIIIIDRTPFLDGPVDMVSLQTMHPPIYEASYPCRFFSSAQFETRMAKNWTKLWDWVHVAQPNRDCQFRGAVYSRKIPARSL